MKGRFFIFTEAIHLVIGREKYYRYVYDCRIAPVSERKRMLGAREHTENTAKTNGYEKKNSCTKEKQIDVELERKIDIIL